MHLSITILKNYLNPDFNRNHMKSLYKNSLEFRARRVAVSRSILAALLIALLLPAPILSLATPADVIYKAGDWLLYRYVVKLGGGGDFEFILNVTIEEVSATRVKYDVELEEFLSNGIPITFIPLPQKLSSSTVDLSTAAPLSGEILINPSYTGTYNYNEIYNEIWIYIIYNYIYNKAYNKIYIKCNYCTVTYYKGVTTKLSINVTLGVSTTPTTGATESTITGMIIGEIDLIGTSIEELKKVEAENKPPVADFSYSPSNPLAGDSVSFNDRSYDPDGSVVSWHWNFGDSTTSSEKNPTHVFTSPGTYIVTLTVKDDRGAEESISKTVYVSQATSFDFSVSTSGTSFSIMQGGGSITVPVSVSLIEGTPSSVSLSLFDWMTEEGNSLGSENLWFTVEFNPSSGTPPFDSTLTIKVAKEVPPGTYKADIVAYHDGIPKHTTITVNVIPALEIISYGYWIIQTKAEQYQPTIPAKIATPSTLPIETYSRAIRPPVQGEDFLVSIVVKNRGNFDIIIPGSLSTTIILPSDHSKYGVIIDDPRLVEATQLDENTVAVSGTRSSITIKPGETTTIFYRCKAQWHFIPPPEVVSLDDIIKQIMDASLGGLLDSYSEVYKTIFKVILLNPKEASRMIEVTSGAYAIGETAEIIGIPLEVLQTYQKLKELEAITAPCTIFTLSFPLDITNEKISVIVSMQEQKIKTFNDYKLIRPAVTGLATDIGIIVGSALGSAVGPEGTVAGAFIGNVAGVIVGKVINSATDSLVLSYLYNDPSLNYTLLVPPPTVPEAFYKLPNNTESKALLYEYLYLAYLNASTESLARANGAIEMNNTKYYYLQLRNARMYAANASTYYSKLVPLLEQIVEELNKSGYLNEVSFIKGREYIAKNGLPSNVTKLLTELGFTKYINIHEVEERLKSAKYEPLNVTAFKEALELSKKYNPAAFFNESLAEELESVSNKTLCQVILNETGLSKAVVKVDGKDYPLPTSLYLNLGTKHNITFSQVISEPSYNYVFKELHVGNETFTSPSYQLDVLEPVSIIAVYEGKGGVEPLPPETLSQIYILVIAIILILAMILGYIKWGTGKSTYS